MKRIAAIAVAGVLTVSMLVGCTQNGTSSTPSLSTPDVSVSTPPGTAVTPDVTPSTPDVAPPTSPSQDAPLPKIAIFGSANYLLTDNDSTKVTADMLGEKLGESAGFIDFTGNLDESLFTTDFANSISEDAVFYAMNGHDSSFRIVIEADGAYYILESTETTIADFAQYAEGVTGATILDLMGITEYKQLTADEASNLVDVFATTTPAQLENSDYENIAKAQSEGKAYNLRLNFADGTFTELVVVPELNVVSIGQTYHTSETLGADIDFAFGDLPQTQNLPMN